MATTKVYVGNIPWTATEQDITAFFRGYNIRKISIITDRETGRPKGFAFVELESADIEEVERTLDGQEMGGRTIKVAQANEKPRPDRSHNGGRSHHKNDFSKSWKD